MKPNSLQEGKMEKSSYAGGGASSVQVTLGLLLISQTLLLAAAAFSGSIRHNPPNHVQIRPIKC